MWRIIARLRFMLVTGMTLSAAVSGHAQVVFSGPATLSPDITTGNLVGGKGNQPLQFAPGQPTLTITSALDVTGSANFVPSQASTYVTYTASRVFDVLTAGSYYSYVSFSGTYWSDTPHFEQDLFDFTATTGIYDSVGKLIPGSLVTTYAQFGGVRILPPVAPIPYIPAGNSLAGALQTSGPLTSSQTVFLTPGGGYTVRQDAFLNIFTLDNPGGSNGLTHVNIAATGGVTAVPEPSAIVAGAIGAGVLAAFRRRRARKVIRA